jgi:hypothetical protein
MIGDCVRQVKKYMTQKRLKNESVFLPRLFSLKTFCLTKWIY